MSSQALAVLTPDELRALVREAVREVAASPPPAANDDVLTRDQAAALLQVHPVMVVRYVTDEGLPARKLGTDWRFTRGEVVEWFRKRPLQKGPTRRGRKKRVGSDT